LPDAAFSFVDLRDSLGDLNLKGAPFSDDLFRDFDLDLKGASFSDDLFGDFELDLKGPPFSDDPFRDRLLDSFFLDFLLTAFESSCFISFVFTFLGLTDLSRLSFRVGLMLLISFFLLFNDLRFSFVDGLVTLPLSELFLLASLFDLLKIFVLSSLCSGLPGFFDGLFFLSRDSFCLVKETGGLIP